MSARGILLRSAELLEQNGWCQGAFMQSGRMCAAGAMMQAETEQDDHWTASGYHEAQIAMAETIGAVSIPFWNDAPERTAEDVILAFKRAAEQFE